MVVVGDGVDDVPAPVTVHVGVALGGAGADLTVRAADAIVAALALAHCVRRVVVANLAIAGMFIARSRRMDLFGTLPLRGVSRATRARPCPSG